jgi:type IV secretion system protein VirD4
MVRLRKIIAHFSSVLLLGVGASSLATQWVAANLLYNARLGRPVIIIGDLPVYAPWQMFEWWCSPDVTPIDLVTMGGVVIAITGVAGAGFLLAFARPDLRLQRGNTTFGSARWALSGEIERARLFQPRGVFLGTFWHESLFGRRERYLRHDGDEHLICFAPTRSGKGVGLVVPTLLSWTSSVVVVDIKSENWRLTAGWRRQFSHCLIFDPTSPKTHRYNPLLEIRKGEREVRDVQNIADILVDPDGILERRNHWDKTSHALLVGVILHVLYAEKDKTLARVGELLSDPSRSFERTLRIMMATNHLGSEDEPRAHPVVAATARELLNKSENERSGVLSTAVSLLSLYRDPTVAEATAECDWRVADLVARDAPVSLYLVVPPSDLSRTKPLIRLILNQICRRLTEELASVAGRSKNRQLLLMLDEFPALGRLEFFESNLAFMAGYGIRTYLIAQSLNQIAKAYGENNSILDNCHLRIAFACNDERTAKRISDALGTATQSQKKQSYSGRRSSAFLGHVSESVQLSARPLLTPGEVMRLPSDEAIVLLGNLPPIRARKLRHFQDANFVRRLLPPPLQIESPLLPVDGADHHDWHNLHASEHTKLKRNWFDLVDAEPAPWAGTMGPEAIVQTVEPGDLVDPLLFSDRQFERMGRNAASVILPLRHDD